jgi:hypothetical protein
MQCAGSTVHTTTASANLNLNVNRTNAHGTTSNGYPCPADNSASNSHIDSTLPDTRRTGVF